jgi:hypothetical protein
MAGGALASAALVAIAFAVTAADFPEPKTSEYVIKNFGFHSGEVMPEMKVSYTTVGDPSGEPVLMLHGTTGSAKSMLTEGFAGALYGPGQALDATKYFIIIPDAIGTGGSSKPSDGLRAAFPEYNYDDMVAAQYDLVKNHLGIDHLTPRHGQLDGRDADLDLGRHLPRLHGCARADGFSPRPDVRSQLDDAADADRCRAHGSGLGRGQLQGTAAQSRDRQCLVLHRDQQRRAAAG